MHLLECIEINNKTKFRNSQCVIRFCAYQNNSIKNYIAIRTHFQSIENNSRNEICILQSNIQYTDIGKKQRKVIKHLR